MRLLESDHCATECQTRESASRSRRAPPRRPLPDRRESGVDSGPDGDSLPQVRLAIHLRSAAFVTQRLQTLPRHCWREWWTLLFRVPELPALYPRRTMDLRARTKCKTPHHATLRARVVRPRRGAAGRSWRASRAAASAGPSPPTGCSHRGLPRIGTRRH